MRSTKVTLALALMALMALPVLAQGNRGGSGNLGMGRQGAQWQTDIRNAKEEQAKLEAELLRLSEEEWMNKALAWVEYDFAGENQLTVEDSRRVAMVDPGKKAEVEELTINPPTWGIAWGRKPPRFLKLVLTDVNGTTVECPLAARKKMDAGFLGVFVGQNGVLCVPHEPFPKSEDEEPAP
ncbi:MAG: hypothetical protein ACE5GX_16555 [Thermoanaerobaculia bacterium]